MWAGVWVWARAARVPGQGTSFPTSSTGGGRAQCSVQPQLPAERDCCWPAELAQLGRNGTAQRSTSGAEQASQQERRGGGGQRARHCCPPLPKAKKRTSRTSERHWQPPAGGTALTHTQKRKRADSRPRAHTRRKGKKQEKKREKGGEKGRLTAPPPPPRARTGRQCGCWRPASPPPGSPRTGPAPPSCAFAPGSAGRRAGGRAGVGGKPLHKGAALLHLHQVLQGAKDWGGEANP